MPFLRRQDIEPKVLEASNKKAKDYLRGVLLNPALTAEQRVRVREEITLLGLDTRLYDANRPPRPGAVSFE